jgi:transcription initiation factor IIF auxiliary subunit
MYEEEEDEPRAMICCDKCSAWQHNQCMGLPEDYEADVYFCEQCKPEEHKDLLNAIKRGEKPWEEAQQKREAAKASKGKKCSTCRPS